MCRWWVCGGEFIKIGATHIEAVASVKVKSTDDTNVKVGNISRQHPATSQRLCLGGWGLSREARRLPIHCLLQIIIWLPPSLLTAAHRTGTDQVY